MILDQPMDPITLQKLSEAEKVTLLKKAYTEFLAIVQTEHSKQKHILNQAVDTAEDKKMNQIRQLIQSL